LLFALSELNYLAAESGPRSAKAGAPHDRADYYLLRRSMPGSSCLAMRLSRRPLPSTSVFRTACDLYNFGWTALTEPRSTDAVAVLQGGTRRLPVGRLKCNSASPGSLAAGRSSRASSSPTDMWCVAWACAIGCLAWALPWWA